MQALVNFQLFSISQSTKMILKFRESTISRLERLRKREKEGSDGQEDEKDREIVRACKSICLLLCSSSLLFSRMVIAQRVLLVTNHAVRSVTNF